MQNLSGRLQQNKLLDQRVHEQNRDLELVA
jgi:hypothetical protein